MSSTRAGRRFAPMASSAASAGVHPTSRPTTTSPWIAQLRWFAFGAAAAFFVPFFFSGVLDLHHDVYLAVYFAFVVGLVTTYVRSNEIDLGAVIRRNWKWGVA